MIIIRNSEMFDGRFIPRGQKGRAPKRRNQGSIPHAYKVSLKPFVPCVPPWLCRQTDEDFGSPQRKESRLIAATNWMLYFRHVLIINLSKVSISEAPNTELPSLVVCFELAV